MWYIRTVSEPSFEPLSLEEAKAQCRVDDNDEDALLSAFITSARQLTESELSRAICTQTLELGLDDFPYDDRIRIPRGKLQSIDQVEYTDAGGTNRTLTAGIDYRLNQYAEPAEMVLPFNGSWPSVILDSASPVRIQFTCGYESAEAVPGPIKQALLMTIADWYNNREDVVIGKTSAVAAQLSNGVMRLLTNYRIRNYSPYER